MPIYHTNTFWDYISNESLGIINKAKELLTKKTWNFDEKRYDIDIYYQDISSLEIEYMNYSTIRFPGGLCKYMASKLGIGIENIKDNNKHYSEEEIRSAASEIHAFNPKFEVRDYQVTAVKTSVNQFRTLIESGVGSGKGQPVSLEIPTPAGFKKMGELKIGDRVFGSNGKPTKITGVFPQGVQQVYKVSFTSGKITYCDKAHLWTLYKKDSEQQEVYSTSQLLSELPLETNKHAVPRYTPIIYPKKKFLIKPYSLGVLLGQNAIQKEKDVDYSFIHEAIVKKYLEGSYKQRLELLKGLMDTKGAYQQREECDYASFTSDCYQLVKAVQALVYSLGGKSVLQQSENNEYKISVELDTCPFKYKKEAVTNWNSQVTNDFLKSIEYDHDEETICIKVEAKDELYITSDYVLTHNTSVMSLTCKVLNTDKILILNNNNLILKQIYERLLSVGIDDVSFNPSKEPDYTKRIIILNTAFSDARLNRQDEAYLKLLSEVNTICYDEAQKISALTWFEPLLYTSVDNLRHIIGYSGSPFHDYKDIYNLAEDFRTVALIGEPAFTYKMKDTIADGNIAQPYGYFIRYNNKQAIIPDKLPDNYYMQYRFNITYNKARKKAGFEMIKFLNKNGIKTLVSFVNLKPAQALMKELTEQCNIKCFMLSGKETISEWKRNKRGTLKLETRNGNTEDVKAALQSDYNIIFGSTVMDEGVDIDLFQAVVLFSAGKTPIAGIQRIGRASRKRKSGRNVSFVIDFRDTGGHPTFEEHYMKRRQLMIDSGVKMINNVLDFVNMIETIHKENEEMEK